MSESAKELEGLLLVAKSRERASRRRGLIYTSVPIALGIVFLTTSLYQVSRLNRQANELSFQIDKQTRELTENGAALANIEEQRKDAEAKLTDTQAKLTLATATLADIDKGKGDPKQKARRTLQVLSGSGKRSISVSPEALTALRLAMEAYKKLESDRVEPVVVPNVIGKSYSDARAVLVSAGFSIGTTPEPTKNRIVVRQVPDAGTRSLSKQVSLYFGDTLVPTLIPNVIGKSYSEASAALQSVGLVPTTFDPVGENRIVVSQSPPPGTKSFSKYVALRLRIRGDSLSKPSPTATAQSPK